MHSMSVEESTAIQEEQMHQGRKARKMRNGWFFEKVAHVLTEQEMHRKVVENDSQLCKKSSNVDGTTFKGLFHILQEHSC